MLEQKNCKSIASAISILPCYEGSGSFSVHNHFLIGPGLKKLRELANEVRTHRANALEICQVPAVGFKKLYGINASTRCTNLPPNTLITEPIRARSTLGCWQQHFILPEGREMVLAGVIGGGHNTEQNFREITAPYPVCTTLTQ